MEIPALKYREECVRFVDYHDLERLIVKVYGVFEHRFATFSVVAMEEWTNSTDHTYTVKKEKLNKYDLVRLARFMQDPHGATFDLWVLLIDMCNNGYIEPGKYVISVSW